MMNKLRKEVEDFYKSWVHKNFQKGLRDVKVIITGNLVVIIGIEFLTFVEQSILDDEYSKQAVAHTRRKLVSKFFPILKQNLELILSQEIAYYFVDFSMDDNMSCMTIIFEGEIGER
ncbi:Na-translocating system protein MpsC family protein [Sinanaerobacter chloroacetimidivorans]|nr:Na-translocating system protein MpsC family protein [Sinanaerobacter chloroacetimidivorans]